MKAVRMVIHGFVLYVANLLGLIVGMVGFHALGVKGQLGIQVPIAVVVSVVLYLGWSVLLRLFPFPSLALRNLSEHVFAGLCALVWSPVIFIPLHYFTQGYLTAAGNIVVMAFFQVPVNAIAVLAAWKAARAWNGRARSARE